MCKVRRQGTRGAEPAYGVFADEALRRGPRHRLTGLTDYGPTGNRFTGEINWVQIDIGDDNHDHVITAQ